MRESKDKIKSRMIRNAAQIWGFQEPRAENSFDPLVSLLLGSCAFELEKISSEINNTESRIVERLVNILTPHPLTGPHPAYAIAYARPYKKGARVLPANQFYADIKVSDKLARRTEDKQIFFSPSGSFSLTDGKVRYLAANRKIFEIVDNQYKDIITEKLKKPLPGSALYIGVELNEKPSYVTFFFDIISEHLRQSFFQDLESCRWQTGGCRLKTKMGITDNDYHEHDIYQMINRESDPSSKISDHVNSYFTRQFVTVSLDSIVKTSETIPTGIPSEIAALLDEKDLPDIDAEVTWFELQFNRTLSDELPENLTCSLNCFPVINRRLNEYTGSTRELMNIIPLHTEDAFFDLRSVTNSKGEVYKIKQFRNQEDITTGSALLRTEGIGRFDTRNAMEYLDYLLELMKEESAAFNIIGSDMISSNLRELNQAIARLEKKIEDVQLEKGETAYLMLKPHEGDNQVYVEFWSVNCTLANNIREGTVLNVYRADDVDYNSSRLMTKTTGGKDKPSTEDRINTYRRYLQSGNRVVTKEDIKALCFEFFGDRLSHVSIEKGIEKGSRSSEGFIRTIDIRLSFTKGNEINIAEQNSLTAELLVLLESRSANTFPYRIFFNN